MEIRLISGKALSIADGESIYQALKRQGVYLVASCGGKGICGKCKVKIIKGGHNVITYGKLEQKERDAGIVLACQTIPTQDILIEIPKESRLVVGDKIAVSKSRDLFELLQALNAKLSPIVKYLSLDIPLPTIHDNISDFERLKRSLEEKGIKDMRFSHRFVSEMSKILRDANWKMTI